MAEPGHHPIYLIHATPAFSDQLCISVTKFNLGKMKAHSCQYCRVFVISFPQWIFGGELRNINTLGDSRCLDEWINLGCSLSHVEIGKNNDCLLLQLLYAALQDEVAISAYDLNDLQLEATCSIIDTQWSLSFHIRDSNGLIISTLTPQFWLYAQAGKVTFM